jgi:roadblock/LC7 domain-containing protein
MVRPMTALRTPSWKAVLAIAVAGGALLWHVLACTESPMSFRPGGKDLAFAVVSPYDTDNLQQAGKHTWRMMILTEGAKPRVVEQTDKFMLTAPAYSPDGKYLAYLRIPLLTDKAISELAEQCKKRAEELDKRPAFPAPPGEAAPAAKPADGNTSELAMPALGKTAEFYKAALAGPLTPVRVVVRDAAAPDTVLATATIDLPVFSFLGKGDDAGAAFAYILTRPQYSPDGKWLYFCVGSTAVAVNPKTGDKRLLATPATLASLSPDGLTLAAVGDNSVTFLRTDGAKATTVRLADGLSASGVAWAGKDTLALVAIKDKTPRLDLMKADGTVARTVELPKPEKTGEGNQGELALAPDGEHMVLAYGQEVHFLGAGGKLLNKWASEKVLLCQPTFSPDGKRVAFKQMVKDGDAPAVTHIVFYSPDGKEQSTVELPAPPATQAAK